ncbi:MAG: FkbM family methyltransferase [Armatimonadetes bacterium]|nr:FkbM family methyltransferase [Armatimonadota bacterium]
MKTTDWLKSRLRHMIGRDVRFRPQLSLPCTVLGKNCAYAVDLTRISDESIVYSFGVGENVEFDLELIERRGCRVHAFDPTPRAVDFLKSINPPDRFIMHNVGLAGYDGRAAFHPPSNPDHVSHSLMSHVGVKTEVSLEFEVRRLATIMFDLGHASVDLLKMDIEGAEYAAIEDIVASSVPVKQIVLEFHHRFGSVGPRPTKDAVKKLIKAGYRIFWVSDSGEEYSFIHLER